jgi:hypothetical protein
MAKKGKRARPRKIRKEKDVLSNNPVAKFMHWFNKTSKQQNKRKYIRKAKYNKFDL